MSVTITIDNRVIYYDTPGIRRDIAIILGSEVPVSVDTHLDVMLDKAEITYNNPNHPFHHLSRDVVLDLVQSYVCEYSGVLCDLQNILIESMSDEQLRKLALWLYHELGGTTGE
jgi:hypothetical protein